MNHQVWFVQVASSERKYDHNENLLDYYYRAYRRTFDYEAPRFFLEIPTWIPVLSGIIGKDEIDQSLYILESDEEVEEFVKRDTDGQVTIFMSATSAMYSTVLYLTRMFRRKARVVVGGYVSEERIEELKTSGAIWLDDVKDAAKIFETADPNAAPLYDLFAGWPAIPRLQMSTGCDHNCRFCTVERGVKPRRFSDVLDQIHSFKPLQFKYIYLDDKTFGQARNWSDITWVYESVCRYNPEFEGFIVQTTAPMILAHGHKPAWYELVKFVEIGVETLHPGWLEWMRKPHNIIQTNKAMAICMSRDVQVIPNIMTLLPGRQYENERQFLTQWKDTIPFVNLFRLSCYENSKLGKEVEGPTTYLWHRSDWFKYTPENADETSFTRTWSKTNDARESKKFESWVMHEFAPCKWDIVIPKDGEQSVIATLDTKFEAMEWWEEHFPDVYINRTTGEVSVVEPNRRQ